MSTEPSTGGPRAPDLTKAMTSIWDDAADGYDDQWSHGLKTATERQAWTALLDRLLPQSRLRVLDVGTGTGFIALLLSALGHDVTGIDLSENMMSIGRARAEADGLTTRFIVGDAEAPPMLDAFDVAVARHVLWTLQRPEQAVRAWSGLLRPGGRVIVIDGMWFHTGLRDRALGALGRRLSALRSGKPARNHRYPTGAAGQLPLRSMRSVEPVRNVFVRAGLIDVLSEELRWLDEVERGVMPLTQRMQRRRNRRFLVEGRRPAR